MGHPAHLGARSFRKTRTLHSRPVWTWSSLLSKSNQLPTAGPDVCSVCSYALSPQATHDSWGLHNPRTTGLLGQRAWHPVISYKMCSKGKDVRGSSLSSMLFWPYICFLFFFGPGCCFLGHFFGFWGGGGGASRGHSLSDTGSVQTY